MGIFAGLFGPSQSVGDPNHWILRAIGGGPTHAGTMVNEFTAGNITAVYRAIGIIADTVAQLPLHVFKKTKQGREAADDIPIAEALSISPNPFMSAFVQRQTQQKHALLWGNGYAEIQINGRGQAVSLWPLLPEATGLRKEAGKEPYYHTTINGESIKLKPGRVTHIKTMGHNGYEGQSPIFMHRQAIGLAMALEEFGSKFFKNDAKSGGFLHHPGKLSKSAQDNLANSMGEGGQGGLDNAHRVKVLEEGMKFVQTTIPPEDAQFLGTRTFQIEEISRMYGVPLVLLNSHEKTTSWGSGIESLMIGFVVFTMMPWFVQIEQELNRKLFTEQERKAGYFVKFAVQALLRGDMASRGTFYQTLTQLGAMTPNEVRELEDMNTDPELDFHYFPSNMQRVDQPADMNNPTSVEKALNQEALKALRETRIRA